MTDGVRVAALYKFVDLPDWQRRRGPLAALCARLGLTGTLLLAREGINGTVAGTAGAIDRLVTALRADPAFADLDVTLSHAAQAPFKRLKVRLKREIVSLGVDGVDPARTVGTYVAPGDWNALIADPEVMVIDTRNAYEVALGSFDGAVEPGTRSFRQFPDWVARRRLAERKPKVAMFCTGGIRCEKATSFLKGLGLEQVYHLKGGILRYLETVPEAESLWRGQCFVFDGRVSVTHGLREGEAGVCYGCRMPVTAEDRAAPRYQPGISCPRCHATLTPDRRARFAERQRQIDLAKAR